MEQKISAGTVLLSAGIPGECFFDQSVILVAEYDQKGALGFVINRQFPRALNELVEFAEGPAFPLYEGGPVAQEGLFFLHRRPDLIEGGTPLANGVFMAGNFKQAVEHLKRNRISAADIKIFIGYCGWDPLQLEEEIAEGSWLIAQLPVEKIFAHPAVSLWDEISANKDRY